MLHCRKFAVPFVNSHSPLHCVLLPDFTVSLCFSRRSAFTETLYASAELAFPLCVAAIALITKRGIACCVRSPQRLVTCLALELVTCLVGTVRLFNGITLSPLLFAGWQIKGRLTCRAHLHSHFFSLNVVFSAVTVESAVVFPMSFC